jgi:murein DD-endopeptidase MepM/ murein hydrolase activator NlpD
MRSGHALVLVAFSAACSSGDPTGPGNTQNAAYLPGSHTLFYVPFDSTYASGGATYFPEIGDDPSATEPAKDCRVVQSGSFFSNPAGKFGNALHVSGDIHKGFALFCGSSRLSGVGFGTAIPNYTVGYWIRSGPNQSQGFRILTVLDGGHDISGGCTDTKLLSINVNATDVNTQSECRSGTFSNISVADGQWHNVIIVYDHANSVYPGTTGKLRIYIDGALCRDHDEQIFGWSIGSTFQAVAGAENLEFSLDGDLDELWMEDRAWSANEVAQFFPQAPPRFRWPIDPASARDSLNQDYAQFGHLGTQKFHVGIDIGAATGTAVHAAADGTVRLVPMQPTDPINPDNHCMGNVVIIDHSASGTTGPFTLYAHLQRIRSSLSNGEMVRRGDVLGQVGATGFDQSNRPSCQGSGATGPHLHFEVKDRAVLENPVGGNPCMYPSGSGPCWGYTPGHPNLFGYHDPIEYAHHVAPSALRVVTARQSGVSLRVGPGGSASNTTPNGSYRTLNALHPGLQVKTVGLLGGPTTTPRCAGGWEQVEPVDPVAFPGLRFVDATRPPGSIPDGWVCVDLLMDVP